MSSRPRCRMSAVRCLINREISADCAGIRFRRTMDSGQRTTSPAPSHWTGTITVGIGRAAPEGIACVTALVADLLAHGLSTFRATWRSRGLNRRIARGKPGTAHSLAESPLFDKGLRRTQHLPRQQGTGSTNDNQDGVGGRKWIFVFKPARTTFAHGQSVLPIGMIKIVRPRKGVKFYRPYRLVARILSKFSSWIFLSLLHLTQRAQRTQSYSTYRDESIPFGFHLSGERSSYFVQTHHSR